MFEASPYLPEDKDLPDWLRISDNELIQRASASAFESSKNDQQALIDRLNQTKGFQEIINYCRTLNNTQYITLLSKLSGDLKTSFKAKVLEAAMSVAKPQASPEM